MELQSESALKAAEQTLRDGLMVTIELRRAKKEIVPIDESCGSFVFHLSLSPAVKRPHSSEKLHER